MPSQEFKEVERQQYEKALRSAYNLPDATLEIKEAFGGMGKYRVFVLTTGEDVQVVQEPTAYRHLILWTGEQLKKVLK